jgi:hypothetical protein
MSELGGKKTYGEPVVEELLLAEGTESGATRGVFEDGSYCAAVVAS